MALQTISASKLRVFRTCHRQYFYKYVTPRDERLPQEKRVGALLGTALHKVIESYYTGENTNSRALFQQIMLETVEQWESDGEKVSGLEWFNKSLKDGRKILEEFDWNRFHPIMHEDNLALELAFSLPFPNPTEPIVMIQGYIDMISNDNGMISVIDHKSTQKVPNADQLAHDPQFLIYAWAYQQMYGILPDAVIFNALRKNQLIAANVLHDFDAKIAQMTIDIQALLHVDTYPRRYMDTECTSYCDFYEACYGKKMKEVASEIISVD